MKFQKEQDIPINSKYSLTKYLLIINGKHCETLIKGWQTPDQSEHHYHEMN